MHCEAGESRGRGEITRESDDGRDGTGRHEKATDRPMTGTHCEHMTRAMMIGRRDVTRLDRVKQPPAPRILDLTVDSRGAFSAR